MEWINVKSKAMPYDVPILVTDGKTFLSCEIDAPYIVENGPRKGLTRAAEIRAHGFGGYEFEYEFDFEDITHWANVELPKMEG